MHVLRVKNVNEALPKGIQLIWDHGEKRDSRNGSVFVMPEPVTTVYANPAERVLMNPVRDANPFFHLFESLWMLGGKNDLEYVVQFAGNMRNYSDDGKVMWGAYGWRWRSFFNATDQLSWAINRLKKDPTDRRVVVQMWSADEDTGVADNGGKDVPCNLTLHFQVNINGQLDMTVFCRSNDIIWGAYGANAVHFSILLEYVAAKVGCPMGRYWQVSDNYHAYAELYEKMAEHYRPDYQPEIGIDPYLIGLQPFPLVTKPDTWDGDLMMFLEDPTAIGFRDPFFRKIAVPMFMAHRHYRDNEGAERYEGAREILNQMPVSIDWKMASLDWIDRREANWRKAADDGPHSI